MDAEDLKRRTKTFAIRIIRLVEALPNTSTARVIGNQRLLNALRRAMKGSSDS